jgi:hypothetical protein
MNITKSFHVKKRVISSRTPSTTHSTGGRNTQTPGTIDTSATKYD